VARAPRARLGRDARRVRPFPPDCPAHRLDCHGPIGKLTLGWIDKILQRVPIVKSIYGSARQLTNAVFVDRSSLRRTVIAEYPRHGLLAVGSLRVTTESRWLTAARRSSSSSRPRPTRLGLARAHPEADITETAMSIEDGLKLVVSGGVIKPADVGTFIRPKS